ncbi:MAG TPA: DUF6776 family protein [Nevskiaceae bacterium]|nr:DUF6776 family protein [Nevskiaceae bacterium]
MAKPNIVIAGKRRARTPLLIALGAMLVVLAVPMLYGFAHSAAMQDSQAMSSQIERANADRDRIARQLREALSRNDQLQQDVTDLQHGRDIDRQACLDVQKSMSGEQQEVASLREQLAFYRGVVSPQALQSGLHVNELRISAGAQPGSYHFDLVLVQAARQEHRAKGRAELRVIGRDATAQRSLGLADLAQGGGDLGYSFRHFQELGGEFRLPAGFHPSRAIVTLMPDGGDSPHVEEEFDWTRIYDKSTEQAG